MEAKIESGELTLSSKSGNFNANADDNGALLYQELRGDFVMECMITGMTGSENRRTPSYNEGGLMVLDDSNMDDQQIVQMGVFPNYNCGNMLTTVSNHGRRPQFPCGNGWDYAQWMQIERQGNYEEDSPYRYPFHVVVNDICRHETGCYQMEYATSRQPIYPWLFCRPNHQEVWRYGQ